MSIAEPQFWVALLEIIWINILLSGDNAVVIAMACRQLSPRARWWGMSLGAGVALLLRIAFTAVAMALLAIPWLKVIGALALAWIAVSLIDTSSDDDKKVKASDNLWRAVVIIALADLVMSLDNVVAIAAAAKGSWLLLIIGLVLTVPLIVAGSALITGLLERFPILVIAGGALLGWVAGDMLMSDTAVTSRLGPATAAHWRLAVGLIAAGLVVVVGRWRVAAKS